MNSPRESPEELHRDTVEILTDRLSLRWPRNEKEEEEIIQLTFSAAHTIDANGRKFTDGMLWEPPEKIDITREFMEKN